MFGDKLHGLSGMASVIVVLRSPRCRTGISCVCGVGSKASGVDGIDRDLALCQIDGHPFDLPAEVQAGIKRVGGSRRGGTEIEEVA
jgi:hypothetical protein